MTYFYFTKHYLVIFEIVLGMGGYESIKCTLYILHLLLCCDLHNIYPIATNPVQKLVID